MTGPRYALHLVRRFLGALRPGGPPPAEEEWARSNLKAGEVELWNRMPGADRRHAAVVARRVEHALGDLASPPVLAAALLHDVGKIESGLGAYGRVVATLSGLAVGREHATEWSRRRGFTRRVGLYLRHPDLGADRLAMAGSDPLTVAWTREHHLPADRWTVPAPLAQALKAADDD